MRKRSGGLHCQTEQQFIQLAQLSQQKCGLYYDDELNRKKTQLSRTKHKQNKKSQPQKKKADKPSVFMDFDFNEDDIEENQMRAELVRSSCKHLCINITIICARPQLERMELERILNENHARNKFEEDINFTLNKLLPISSIPYTNNHYHQCEQRLIDLHIHKILDSTTGTYTAYKFWFVKINSLNAQICATYLNMTTQLFRINHDLDEDNNLLAFSNQEGKRHAIRDAEDYLVILNSITNSRDFFFGEKSLSEVSLFSPKYISNQDEFFQGWDPNQFLQRKR